MSVEVFHNPTHYALTPDVEGEPYPHGWYYWYAQPGCLPDSDPIGPFDSEAEAIAAAEQEAEDFDAESC